MRRGPVILVHGFLATSASMRPLARALRGHGWATSSFTRNSLASLDGQARALERHTKRILARSLARREAAAPCFVTHSLGALVVRRLLADGGLPAGACVVMLAPPNAGSRLARHASDRLFKGPLQVLDPLRPLHAGGTGAPRGPLPDIGIIAGVMPDARPLFGARPLHDVVGAATGRLHDGKVFVDETRLAGAKDFITMPFEHGDLPRRTEVALEISNFLQTARFSENARQATSGLLGESPSGSHRNARGSRR